MLWLCIDLPHLPVDVFQRGRQSERPFAVVEGSFILATNALAAQGGVCVGMRLTAALALLPWLQRRERARDAEARALERLAGWSLQFTSAVSLQPPRALLLEIGGSLRYFGGLEATWIRLRTGLEALGYQHAIAIAPTPTAAWLLARAGCEQPVIEVGQLEKALAELPAQALPLDRKQHEALQKLGLYTLGDCLALPRGALARRFGPDLIRQLDQALGRLPEPRRSWQAPPRFRSELELPAEINDCEQLHSGLNRLILELCGYLRGIGSGSRRLAIHLRHRHRSATSISMGLMACSRDPIHLLELTRQRLERLSLPAPVIGLVLATRHIERLPPCHRSLVSENRNKVEEWSALVERLSARLGEHAIRGLQVRAVHRPERAWRYVAPGRESPIAIMAERPLWLLPQPRPLKTRNGQPLWHGPLVLYQGPERIESGWWDGADCARDYYVARNATGERLWIFRERRSGRAWYLQGFFA